MLRYLYPGYIDTQEAKDGAWIWWKIAEGKVPTIWWGESILRDFNRQEVEKGLAQLRAATKAESHWRLSRDHFNSERLTNFAPSLFFNRTEAFQTCYCIRYNGAGLFAFS